MISRQLKTALTQTGTGELGPALFDADSRLSKTAPADSKSQTLSERMTKSNQAMNAMLDKTATIPMAAFAVLTPFLFIVYIKNLRDGDEKMNTTASCLYEVYLKY